MTDLIFTGGVTTKAGQRAYIEHLKELAKDPDMKQIILKIMESARNCPHDSETCPYVQRLHKQS